MLILRVTIVAVLMARAISPGAESQVSIGLQPWNYLQPQHMQAPDPNANYVFVAGERIVVELELSNRGAESVRLNTRNLPPRDLAKFVLLRKDTDTWRPVPLRLSLAEEPHVSFPGQTLSAAWGDTVDLPHGSLSVPLEVRSDANIPPGIYHLRITDVPLTCEPDCHVRNHAGLFRFEVRDGADLSARCDLLIRQAWNALIVHSRPSDAEAPVAELLRIHPRSVWGHQLRGQIAEARKQWHVAADEYDTAFQILVRREDTVYAPARPADVQDRIADLRMMRDRLRQRAPRG